MAEAVTATELANTYTARELATRLAAAEASRTEARRRLDICWTALGEIERGEWTLAGTRIRAKEARTKVKERVNQ